MHMDWFVWFEFIAVDQSMLRDRTFNINSEEKVTNAHKTSIAR